jgi:SAM-dependent methyltransferase
MEFADSGVDISPAMLALAQARWPAKSFQIADAASLPFPDASFDAVFCWHLCMHLAPEKVAAVIAEAHRVLRPGGRLVIDFPSRRRRRLLRQRVTGWHGATSFDGAGLQALFARGWQPITLHGILFLPVHRLPVRLRAWCAGLDAWLTRSPLREFSSYLAVVADKAAAPRSAP